jgi:hypothetical protein
VIRTMTKLLLHPASSADLPRIYEVRHGTAENRLTDPALVTEAEVAWYLDEAIFCGAKRPCRSSSAPSPDRLRMGIVRRRDAQGKAPDPSTRNRAAERSRSPAGVSVDGKRHESGRVLSVERLRFGAINMTRRCPRTAGFFRGVPPAPTCESGGNVASWPNTSRLQALSVGALSQAARVQRGAKYKTR